jgi:hypothetical protein
VALLIVADAAVVVTVGIVGVDLQCPRVVGYGFIDLPDAIKGKPPIKISLKVCRVAFDGFTIELDGRLEILSFSGFPPGIVVEIGLFDCLLF